MNKTKEYDYGRENDIERLRKATAGIHSAKLNKMPKGHLDSIVTTRPEGFKTAILVVVDETKY